VTTTYTHNDGAPPEVLQLKEAHRATVNDIVVSLCAGALRTWLEGKDELPDERLLAMVPVSVRTAAEHGTFGNKIATKVVALPTDEADPIGRIRACRDSLATPTASNSPAGAHSRPRRRGREQFLHRARNSRHRLRPTDGQLHQVPGKHAQQQLRHRLR
jgi:hypothetical protein